MKPKKLYEEIMLYMKNYNMLEIKQKQKEVKILPLVGKIIGRYPKGFNTEGEK